ncbi:hypothetical protein PR048_017157 [Dryococelus australis]|uniref:Uncharacterized protein n=1 Tax=Dryococelus australis TaxID=614101 RepID=A0ABQ9H8T2_9NEOP|nr:hypothetical protein PR048_017157 [Dryococelus australis]
MGYPLRYLPHVERSSQVLTETQAEHRKYCNTHALGHADMPTPEKNGRPSVLRFQNYHNIDKIHIVVYATFDAMPSPVQTCQPNLAKLYTYRYQQHLLQAMRGNIILPCKTTILPTHVEVYTGEDAEQIGAF